MNDLTPGLKNNFIKSVHRVNKNYLKVRKELKRSVLKVIFTSWDETLKPYKV